MNLSDYQLQHLQDKRNELLVETIKVWTITKTGSGNIYGQGTTETESSENVSAKVGWGAILEKNDQAGGFVEIGDCRALVSKDDQTKFEGDNKYVEIDSKDLSVVKVVPVTDTNECLIYLKRR